MEGKPSNASPAPASTIAVKVSRAFMIVRLVYAAKGVAPR